jgi:hypothetical protein
LIAIKKNLALFVPVIRLEAVAVNFFLLTESEYSVLHLKYYSLETNEYPVILTTMVLNLSNICPALPSSAYGYDSNDVTHLLIRAFEIKLLSERCIPVMSQQRTS